MAKFNRLTPMAAALGAAVVASALSTPVMAADNPFATKELSGGYQQLAGKHAEGKCGEGKCGEGKCGEGKCGEGKCGGAQGDKEKHKEMKKEKRKEMKKEKKKDGSHKSGEGKCGEGKCGG
jgi:uncharacterized low-complexity protein